MKHFVKASKLGQWLWLLPTRPRDEEQGVKEALVIIRGRCVKHMKDNWVWERSSYGGAAVTMRLQGKEAGVRIPDTIGFLEE